MLDNVIRSNDIKGSVDHAQRSIHQLYSQSPPPCFRGLGRQILSSYLHTNVAQCCEKDTRAAADIQHRRSLTKHAFQMTHSIPALIPSQSGWIPSVRFQHRGPSRIPHLVFGSRIRKPQAPPLMVGSSEIRVHTSHTGHTPIQNGPSAALPGLRTLSTGARKASCSFSFHSVSPRGRILP